MAENNLQFKVIADYDEAIKEWKKLRDSVASTTEEYQECAKEINELKIARAELTGENLKANQAESSTVKSVQSSTNAYKAKQKELERTFNAQKKATKSTGAGTSAALELGRAISDSNYGIRGMANNLTQFASQFSFMSTAVDGTTGKVVGFKGALVNLGKAIKANAFLLGFTLLITAMEKISMSSKKAVDSIDKFNSATGAQYTKLTALKTVVDEDSLSRKELNEVIEAANKEFKDLNLELDKNNKLTKESLDRLNEKTEAVLNLAKAQALQGLLEEQYSKLLPLQSKTSELTTEAAKKEKIAVEALSNAHKEYSGTVALSNANRARGLVNDNKEAIDEINKEIDRLLKLGTDGGIIDLFFKGKDKGSSRGGSVKAIKDLELQFLDLQKLRDSYNKKTVESIDELEKIELASLRKRRDDFVANEGEKTQKYIDALRERLKVETDTVKKNEINTKIAEANIKLNDVKVEAYKEYQETLTELAFFYEKKRSEEELKEHNRKLKELGAVQKDNEKLSGQFEKGKTSSTSIPLLKEGVEVARKLKQEADQGLEFAIKNLRSCEYSSRRS